MRDNKKGVTLIEVIVAMAVIAIAVIGSLEFFTFCQKNFIINSTLKLRASDFARETMEGLYCLDSNDSQLVTPIEVKLPEDEFGMSGGCRSYTITDGTDPTHGGKYSVITVTVSDYQ